MIRLVHHKDDASLVRACVKGKRAAQEQLYARFAPKMHSVCRGYAPDEDTANELLQEGFIKVFRNIGQYNGKGALEGWIRRLMVNNAVDYLRKNHHYRFQLELNDQNLSDNEHITTENEVWKGFDADDFDRITQHLPAGYKLILNLYIVEGYTHKEIGEKLGISIGTSKSQYSKAKKYLRKTIDQYVDADLLAIYEEQFFG